jgi:hypothetical protein
VEKKNKIFTTVPVIDVNMRSLQNGIAYQGPLFFGNPSTMEADLVYDTGSGYLTVSHVNCTNCTNKIYDDKKSD